MSIKAIETRYKGYRFRSRLEARYAVLFDALGLEWEYEPEGYDLGGDLGNYLPDFFIKGNRHYGPWIEIKGRAPLPLEVRKIEVLCVNQGAYGLLLWGDPAQERFVYVHKEAGAYADENPPHVHLGVSKDEWARATDAARSARFEHGESGGLRRA